MTSKSSLIIICLTLKQIIGFNNSRYKLFGDFTPPSDEIEDEKIWLEDKNQTKVGRIENSNEIYLNIATEKSFPGILPVKLLEERSLSKKRYRK